MYYIYYRGYVQNVTSVLYTYRLTESITLASDRLVFRLFRVYIYIKYTRKQGKSNFLEYSTVKFNLVVSIAKTLCFKLIVQRPRWHLVRYTFSSNNLYTIKTQSCEYNIKYTYYKGWLWYLFIFYIEYYINNTILGHDARIKNMSYSWIKSE